MKIMVFDCETGGLKAEECPITEIGLVILEMNNEGRLNKTTEYVQLIKPYGKYTKLEPKAIEKTGLTPDILEAKGVSAEVAFEGVVAAMTNRGKNKIKPLLAGHNVTFDIAFLAHLFAHNGKSLASYVRSNNGVIEYADTMIIGKFLSLAKNDLTSITQELDIDLVGAHRAMADVEATIAVLQTYIDRLRSQATGAGDKTTTRFRDTFEM